MKRTKVDKLCVAVEKSLARDIAEQLNSYANALDTYAMDEHYTRHRVVTQVGDFSVPFAECDHPRCKEAGKTWQWANKLISELKGALLNAS